MQTRETGAKSVLINIKYFAAIRDIVGKREEQIQVERGSTVDNVLTRLTEIYGERLRNYVFDEKGHLKGNLSVLINGENIGRDGYDRTVLRSKDILVILPPIAGG